MLLDRLLDAAAISLRNTRRTHSEGVNDAR
jgi:hypothetical protein